MRSPAPAPAAPRSGRSWPASSRSSVVLPTPLTPTRPARAPSSRTKERPSNSGAPSCALVRSVALSMCVSLSGREGGRRARTHGARSTPRHRTTRPMCRVWTKGCGGLATPRTPRVEPRAMAVEYGQHDIGLSWWEDSGIFRASHALVDDGRVWIVDPVDAGDALERVRALGEPVAVLQLLDRHNRDSAAVAKRLGVPHHKVPAVLPDSPFSVLNLDWGPMWKEVALWWPERTALVVPESLGTAPLFAVGPGPVGVHPMRRIAPPMTLRAFVPEHLLVGHGPAVHGKDAGGGLIDALERSRSDIPRMLLRVPGAIRSMVARR